MNKNQCIELLKNMNLMAATPKDIPASLVEFYIESLEPHGWDNVFHALRLLMKTARGLPLVAEIEKAMGIVQPLSPEKEIDLQAATIISRIKESFSKFGYTDPAGAKAYIGEVGWAAMGGTPGWIELCQTDDAHGFPARLAQIREAAKGLMLLPPAKQRGFLAKDDIPRKDHAEARRIAATKQLAEAKAAASALARAESDKQTSTMI